MRGTEFGVQVLSGGRTVVDLYKGLLGVEDRRGQQVLLHPNERLQVDLRGLGTPNALPSQRAQERNRFHSLMQREMALDMSKQQVMAAAVNEIKAAEFQQGKSLIDVFGKRVRLEEYIVRPQPDQFKLVVLNSRQDSFNYFYYLGTFNTTLPTDLTAALRGSTAPSGAAPTYWLTAFETGAPTRRTPSSRRPTAATRSTSTTTASPATRSRSGSIPPRTSTSTSPARASTRRSSTTTASTSTATSSTGGRAAASSRTRR